jgi:hypothetical protein
VGDVNLLRSPRIDLSRSHSPSGAGAGAASSYGRYRQANAEAGHEATLAKDSESITLNLPQPGAEQTAAIPPPTGTRSSSNRRR